jgi:biopolymer transport protein TolR
MQVSSDKQLNSEMNLTPLIDVLLVLLIIFMVVIPNRSVGEQAEIPQPSRPDVKHDTNSIVVVQLIQQGQGKWPSLKINQEQVAWDELEPRLHELLELRADRTAFLKGDPEVDFEYVANVLDLSRRAGAERVGLIEVEK